MVNVCRLAVFLLLFVISQRHGFAQRNEDPTGRVNAEMTTLITGLRDEWTRHLSLREVDPAVAMYAPNAVFIDPHGTHEVGPKSLKKLFTFVISSFDSDLHLKSGAISIAGDIATDTGRFQENLHQRGDPAGAVIPFSGEYLTKYKRSPDGQWKIIEQAWTIGVTRHPQTKANASK